MDNENIIGRMAAANLKLSQFSGFDLVDLDLKASNKEEVLRRFAELLVKSKHIDSLDAAYDALMERETLASTGMGLGVAVPHGRSTACRGLTIAFGKSEKGIEFDSFDGQPVKLFFAVLVPVTSIHLHLQVLASLSILLRQPENRKRLLDARFPQQVLDFLDGE